MAVTWLPQVASCCIFVKDLSTAVVLVAAFSIIYGLLGSISMAFGYSICLNYDRTSGLGLMEQLLAWAGFLALIAYVVGAAILLWMRFRNRGSAKLFVYSSLVVVVVTILHDILYLIAYYKLIEATCVYMKDNVDDVLPSSLFISLFVSNIVCGLLIIHYAMVANSYDMESGAAAAAAAAAASAAS